MLTLYELLDEYARHPKRVESWQGVAVKGRILPAGGVQAGVRPARNEKVTSPFRRYRQFSETGGEGGARVISVLVWFPKTENLAPNLWLMVQGKVVPGTANGEPAIEAVEVSPPNRVPENLILTPQGEQPMPTDDDHT